MTTALRDKRFLFPRYHAVAKCAGVFAGEGLVREFSGTGRPASQFAEAGHQVAGDRAGCPVTDGTTVEADDGDHLGRRSCQEALVCDVDVVSHQRSFPDLVSGIPGQVDDRVAGDALEDSGIGGRSADQPILDNEDVVPGALCHITLLVQHEALPAACPSSLHLGHHVIEIVQ